jgi:hypothetical protein
MGFSDLSLNFIERDEGKIELINGFLFLRLFVAERPFVCSTLTHRFAGFSFVVRFDAGIVSTEALSGLVMAEAKGKVVFVHSLIVVWQRRARMPRIDISTR